MTRIDLNADCGESYGAWRLGDDGPQRDWEPLSTHLPADLREDAA